MEDLRDQSTLGAGFKSPLLDQLSQSPRNGYFTVFVGVLEGLGSVDFCRGGIRCESFKTLRVTLLQQNQLGHGQRYNLGSSCVDNPAWHINLSKHSYCNKFQRLVQVYI